MSVERFKIGFICSAVRREYDSLDGSVRAVVDKGMLRLALRADEIGKPLSGALTGCRELKFRSDGIRLIYRICGERIELVEIIAIGKRDKGEVFGTAENRLAGKAR